LYYLLFVAADDDNDDAQLNDGDYFIAGNELMREIAAPRLPLEMKNSK
jgi:hypothetical protein